MSGRGDPGDVAAISLDSLFPGAKLMMKCPHGWHLQHAAANLGTSLQKDEQSPQFICTAHLTSTSTALLHDLQFQLHMAGSAAQ